MKDITEKFEEEFGKSTKLWHTTLDAMSEPIFLIDLNYKIIQCNRATLDILGKTRYSEIIGHSCWELVHDTSGPVDWCPMKSMLESGNREVTIRQLNGKWVEISADPVFDYEGKINGAVHVITDITARKEAEDALRESEQHYRTILNSLNDPMHVIDIDLRIVFKNPAMTNWLKKLNINSDIVGKTVFEAFPFLNYDKIYNEYEKVFRTGELLVSGGITEVYNRNIITETLKIPIISEGEVSQIITILRDITEQAIVEEKYKNIIDNLMDTILIMDLKGQFLYASPQIYDLSGYKPEEIIGKNGFTFIHPDDLNYAVEVLKRAMEQKKRAYLEYRTLNKEGDSIYVSASGRIVNFEGEDRIIAIIRDISERKISTKMLKESEEKYRALLENFQGIAFQGYTDFTAAFFQGAVEEITGYTEDDFISGKVRWDQMIHPDNLPEVSRKIQKFHEDSNKKNDKREYRIINKNGDIKWILEFIQKFYDTIKQIDGVRGIVVDITDKKLTEKKLEESEKKYRYLIENSIQGVWIVDYIANTVFVNPSMANILGYSVEEMIGKSLFSFMDEDQKQITKSHLEKRKKGISEERDAIAIHKNGDNVFLRIRATPIFDDKGNYEGTYGFLADITQRKLAEQKLKESEAKFRNITEQSLMGVVILQDDVIKYGNQKLADIFGYEIEEILSWKRGEFIKTIAPEFQDLVIEQAKKKQLGFEDILTHYKFKGIRKTGEEICLENYSKPIEYEGKPADLATLIDITEYKIAEENLKKSEQKYSHLFMSSPYSIVIANMNGIIIDCNFLEDKITGYKKEDIISKNMLDVPLFPKEYLSLVMKDFNLLLKGKIPELNEIQILRKDGTQVWVQPSASIFKIENASYIQIIMQEITKRKYSEEKLKESEEKYRLISENTDDLIAVYNEDGNIEYLNAETHSRVLGYNLDKFFDKSFRDVLVHEDDKDVADKFGVEGLSKDNFYYHFRLKHKNGNYLWFEVTGKTFVDNNGNKKILCVSRNIDEKRAAEHKIKESEENFRTIAEQAFIGTLIIQDDKVEYANSALLQIFEYSHEEIDNWRKDDLIKLIYPEDLQYLREYREKLRTGESDINQYYSYRVFTKYGKIKWIDQFSRSIIYRGKPAELVTIMDITEKKKAEQELIKLNSLKSELLRRTSHELKTPLVSIKGFSDLLLTVHKEKLDDYVLATIHEIKLGCERLENLIQDILKTSELESESVELKKSEEDLSFLIKLCVKELQGLIRLRNHEISLEIHDKLITTFEPDQIHLVISNLLNNAIKYTPPNGKIEIRSAITDDSILISIHDNGIGITIEEKKRLFSQFGKIERYGQGLDIISDGSGLGLFITKKIVELHGGKIGVKSRGRNLGSTFYFTLPRIIENKE